jgi:protein-S-isoprenylcysteine O-methyltransferase Ste14
MRLILSNSFVPKSIDSGTETALPSLHVLLLHAFAIQHSVMVRPAFKKWITVFISPVIERSTYVLPSSLALLNVLAMATDNRDCLESWTTKPLP